jgi:hypothetical protein
VIARAHDLAAAGGAARDPQRGGGRRRAGLDQHALLGAREPWQQRLEEHQVHRVIERQQAAAPELRERRVVDLGVGIAEQDRAVGEDEVDVGVAVDVPDHAAGGALEVRGRALAVDQRPARQVVAARDQRQRAAGDLLRAQVARGHDQRSSPVSPPPPMTVSRVRPIVPHHHERHWWTQGATSRARNRVARCIPSNRDSATRARRASA